MTASSSSTALLPRRTAVSGVVLAGLGAVLLSLAPATAGAAGGGNGECPTGTTAFKIEPVVAGPHTQNGITVTLSSVLTSTFVWSSTQPVTTLIVKGGSLPAVETTFVPPASSGTGTAPASPSGKDKLAGLSNVTFCFASTTPASTLTPSPTASASASPSGSVSPSVSMSPSASVSPSASASVSPSASPTATASIAPTTTASPSATASVTSPPTPTGSPLTGVTDGAGSGGGAAPGVAPAGPGVQPAAPVAGAPISGGSGALPVAAPVPAGSGVVAAPAALPRTGIAGSLLLALGLLLVGTGAMAQAAGRHRPAHALPGFWSR